MADTLIHAHPMLLQHADGTPWCGPVVYLGTPATLTHDGWLWDGHGLIGLGAEQPGSLTLDTRRPEVRDQCARVLARILRVPVGSTAPKWHFSPIFQDWTLAGSGNSERTFDATNVPDLASIPLDSTDREALALAVVVCWALAEVEAGRLGKGGAR